MEIRLIFRNPRNVCCGGTQRVGETADGYAVELIIARQLRKIRADIRVRGRDESRGKTRKKSLTPAAKKILVQLYMTMRPYRKPTQVGGVRILRRL